MAAQANTQRRKGWSDATLLARALAAKSDTAYWNAIYELRGRASDPLYDQCVQLAASPIVQERLVGVDVLAQLFSCLTKDGTLRPLTTRYPFPYRKKALHLFLAMLPHEGDSGIVESLLFGIAHNNGYMTRKGLDVVLPFIHAPQKEVRFAAVRALSGLQYRKAVEALMVLTEDPHAHIRNWATFGIGTLCERDNAAIRCVLRARCKDRHVETRHEAMLGLALRKDTGVKPLLDNELPRCTVLTLEAIEALKAHEYLPRLVAMRDETQDDPSINSFWFGELQKCIEALQNDAAPQEQTS